MSEDAPPADPPPPQDNGPQPTPPGDTPPSPPPVPPAKPPQQDMEPPTPPPATSPIPDTTPPPPAPPATSPIPDTTPPPPAPPATSPIADTTPPPPVPPATSPIPDTTPPPPVPPATSPIPDTTPPPPGGTPPTTPAGTPPPTSGGTPPTTPSTPPGGTPPTTPSTPPGGTPPTSPSGTPPPTPARTPPTPPGGTPPTSPSGTPPPPPGGTPPTTPGTPPTTPGGTPPTTPGGMSPPTPGGIAPPTPGDTSPGPKDVPPPLPPQGDALSTLTTSKSPGSGTAVIVGGAVGGLIFLALVAGLIFFVYRQRRGRRRLPPPGTPTDFFYDPRKPTSTPLSEHVLPSTPSMPPPPLMESWQSGGSGGDSHGSSLPATLTGGTFTYDELAAATDGFSEMNMLGQGGFGPVYKGMVRGQEVAIKKLRAGSGQGHREFRAEVDIISRVHHKNLVSLVGFCIYAEQRLLVYEYVPNDTLHAHLHPGSGRPALDWPRRWKIAVGSAKGLAYLHEDCHPKIIHRDIKAANILLDYSFEPKVADFGLAKCQEAEHTTVSTRVMGTFGYLAPEYAASGKVSDRSDVFSFGVMLLELITGRTPALKSSEHDQPVTLVSWARPLLARAMDAGNYEELIDPTLEANYDAYDMTRLVACAAAAVRHTARSRPRMAQIVRYLEGELSLEDLNAGMAPGRSAMQRSTSTRGSGNTDEPRRLRKMSIGSGLTGTGTISSDYTSSEMSEPTSEYGLNPSSEYTKSSATNTVEMRTGATGMNVAEVGRC